MRQCEEVVDYRHDTGRTAKHLEDPLDEQADAVTELMTAREWRPLRG